MADTQEPFPDVVSVDWLAERIGSVKVLDGSWYLPTAQRDPVAEFLQSRLPTAQFFELDTIADPDTTLPHMLPSEEAFGRAADALGIQATDTIVVYDRLGAFSAPRVWWTWRVFGHQKVAVLDGGLPAWESAGHALETSPISAQEAAAPGLAARQGTGAPSYPAHLRRGQVAHWKEVLEAVEAPGARVVDARAAARWRGEAAEPRPGLAAGHMPGSRNVPWDSVLERGRLRSAEQLRAVFAAAGVTPDEGAGEEPWILSCGTGTTACVLDLAMRRAFPGVNTRVYDGSWSEWGQLPGVPIAKGDA